MRASVCRRIAVAKSAPATPSAITAADERREEELGLEAWRARNAGVIASRRGIDELVAELLDGDERHRPSSGSFSRSRRTWTSTVRVPPV